MSLAATAQPHAAPAAGKPRLRALPGGPTLEDSIGATWARLVGDGHAHCPVCDGRLEHTGCQDCGSELT